MCNKRLNDFPTTLFDRCPPIPFSIDLHLTADGVIIVMHDPSLDRTTNGTGLIKDRTWHGYIDGLKSKKEPHVGVPRCIDVLAFLAQDGNEKVWWNIDIKVSLAQLNARMPAPY